MDDLDLDLSYFGTEELDFTDMPDGFPPIARGNQADEFEDMDFAVTGHSILQKKSK